MSPSLGRKRPPKRAKAPPKAPPSRVTVTVADDRLDAIDSVAEALRGAGMKVEQVLGAVGIITGSVPADKRQAVAGIAGVSSIEDETTFRLPPPDAKIQ